MEYKTEKMFSAFKKIAFEKLTSNSHSPEQDTCKGQSMCQQTPLWFQTSMREIFSESFLLRVMEKYDKSALMKISQHWLRESSFLWKCLKFDGDSTNGIKHSEKVFYSEDNCI